LDIDPPRFKRKAPALVAHLTLLAEGAPEDVVEEHVRQSGIAGARLAALTGRAPFGPERLRAILAGLEASGRVLAVERDWFLHPESHERVSSQARAALEEFHRANPLKGGMSREELRRRAGGADERVFAHVLTRLDAENLVRSERDKVRLASHEVQLSPAQQRVVDQVEAEFLRTAAAPPSPDEALGKAGVAGDEEHELFQILVEGKRLVRIKESLFFHTEALDAIQDKLVTLLRERKDIGPSDIKDLLGVSRKYAIPLLEYFDGRRVTMRVGERRVLRGS
jgi:selenocysteine-specific elongation factor